MRVCVDSPRHHMVVPLHDESATDSGSDHLSYLVVSPCKRNTMIAAVICQGIMEAASTDTEVYFCGGGAVNRLLQTVCSKRGMKYAGSSVQ